jgi:hypothetical protein
MDLNTETFSQYFTPEMQSDESFKDYGAMKGIDLINAHKELSGQVKAAGETQAQFEARLAKAVEPLPENATPEQQQAHQAKLRALNGVPEKVTDYKVQLPEGVAPDDPLLMAYANKAHEAGMSPAQVQAGINAFAEYAAQAEKAARETSDNALKIKWGPQYETNLKTAFLTLEAAYKETGLPVEQAKELNFLRNNPGFVQVLFNLSRHYKESQLQGIGGTGSGGSPQSKFELAVSGQLQK